MNELNYNDYFFPVDREKLFRANGEYAGCDALINGITDKKVAVVSEKYHLTTNARAMIFTEELLSKNGIEYELGKTDITPSGGRFFQEFRFPEMRFEVKNTSAHDGGVKDDYIPTIILKNSYDRTSALDFTFGGYRFVCSNGMLLGQTVERIKVAHNYTPDFKEIGKRLLSGIESSVESFRIRSNELNNTPSNWYLLPIFAELTQKMIEEIQILSKGGFAIERDEDGKIQRVIDRDNMSAYALMQLVTNVTTHKASSYRTSVSYQKKIANIFEI
jgi:hypothetical protein